MRKTVALLLTLAFCLALCACGAGPAAPTEPEVTTTAPTEPTEPSIHSIIKNAFLLYPASNEQFKYNVYDTYVEITEYIGDENATEILVPATLEDLPVYVVDHEVFDQCKVPSIVFEDGIFLIHSDFSADVVSVTLPSTLDYVGASTFENCYKLETVVIPEGIDSIQFDAFKHCGALKEVTIPSTVTSLQDETFAYCDNLTTVNLPEGLRRIEDGVFLSCKSLQSLTIPSTVETIGYQAFQGTGLVSIEIPESVQKLHSGAFTACEQLVEVKVYNADMQIIPLEGYTVAILFSQHNENLVVHGKAGSTIAKACATEDIFFQVIA